jgi:hypothetical protein
LCHHERRVLVFLTAGQQKKLCNTPQYKKEIKKVTYYNIIL